MKSFTLPISKISVIRILAMLVILLALATGYYQNLAELNAKKLRIQQTRYLKLENEVQSRLAQ